MIKVKKSEGNPETKEILAEAIVNLGRACARMQKNGLNRKAVVALLHDATKISKKEIEIILNAMVRLEAWYCR